MNVSIESENTKNIISVSGRIDTLTAGELEEKILPLISETHPSIQLNCEAVDYISSSGLRVFILADKKSQQFNGTVTIVGLSDFLKEIFDVSGLTHLFEFV